MKDVCRSEQIFCACRTRVCSKIFWSEGERVQPAIFEEVFVVRRSCDLDWTDSHTKGTTTSMSVNYMGTIVNAAIFFFLFICLIFIKFLF